MKNKKLIISFFLLFIGLPNNTLFAQLNIPTHFSYVEYGFYEQLTFNEQTNTNHSLFSTEINPFYLYNFEVSVANYTAFCNATNRIIPEQPTWSNDLLPVVNVDYYDALDYCLWLSKKYNMPFRIPTKIEWEHAARSGIYENSNFVYATNLPNTYVTYKDTAMGKLGCVSCIQPNEIGLYHMCGNVWEWTLQESKPDSTLIVGGSYLEDSTKVKVTTNKKVSTFYKNQDLGFRVMVDAKAFEFYLFLEKAQMLFKKAFKNKPQLNLTKKGIYYNNLFLEWDNGFETVSMSDDQTSIEFCCWVQEIESLGQESLKPMIVKLKKEDNDMVALFLNHLNSYQKE
jgi:hypothetical protein